MTIAGENQPQNPGEHFPDIFQTAPFAIFEIDYTIPRFIRVNKVTCELSGYQEEEFLSLNPITWLDAEASKRLQERIKQGLTGKKIDENVEFKFKAKDGHDIWTRLSVKPTYNDGKLISALVVAYDITQSKKAEEELKKSQTKYKELIENISDFIWETDADGKYTFCILNRRISGV